MNELVSLVNRLKNSDIKDVINERLRDFKEIPSLGEKEVFRELVFCILAAGTSAELGIKTVDHLGDVIFEGTRDEIHEKLKEIYRFHTIRAGYLHEAREKFKLIDLNHPDVRIHLVKEIKGIGLKEASHFLRNIGFFDYAIVDFHIVDLLNKYGAIEKPKTITPKKYLEIEDVLRELAEKTHMSLGELDLYLWYKETGKILK